MAAYGDQAAALGLRHHVLCTLQGIRKRNLHLHMFASLQAVDGLRSMHLRGVAQDDGVHLLERQAVREVGGDLGDAVFGGHFFRALQIAADQGYDLHAFDILGVVQVFDAEGASASASHCDFDGFGYGSLHLGIELKVCPARLSAFQNQVANGSVGGGYMVKTMPSPRGAVIKGYLIHSKFLQVIGHITRSIPSLPASRT